MKHVYYFAFLLTMLAMTSVHSQKFTAFEKFQDLEKALVKENDTLYVINFWATWCGPCVKELPYFEKFTQQVKGQKIKVILASLDFKKQLESHFRPFLAKKKYSAEVVWLEDKDYNTWFPKVSNDWSGSIPATWLIKGKRRAFHEGDFENTQQLEDFVNTFNNQ